MLCRMRNVPQDLNSPSIDFGLIVLYKRSYVTAYVVCMTMEHGQRGRF